MLSTNVGNIKVTIGEPALNGERHWTCDQVSNGWPVGQDWSGNAWGAITQALWHAKDVHLAANELQRRLDARAHIEDVLVALRHYNGLVFDDRLDDYLDANHPIN